MAKVYDVCKPRQYKDRGQDRTDFVRCGVAFPLPNKDGMSITLFFAMPANTELVILAREPRDERS